jgi:Beta-propeller repeat
MQTKSPLARIGIMAGIPIAALVLFMSVHTHRRAHSSQAISNNHTGATAPSATALTAAQITNFTNAYGKLPLAFEANQGQSAPEVRYVAHGQSYQLFLTNQEAVLALRQPAAASAKSAKGASPVAMRMHHKPNAAVKTSVLRMHFVGANPAAEIAGTNQLPGMTNYFIGNDPKKWHTDIPSYEAVRYQGIYPGVDLLFYGRQQRLEYDFIVAPDADPNAIALRISGARKLELNSQGDVLMSVAGGKVALQKPVVYQEVNGQRREIAGNYTIASDHQIRFAVAAYDRTQPLTIDPVLNYSTYVGGEGFDFANGIALDSAGDAYIAGDTTSTSFPQMNAEAGTPGDIALGTVFVSELNPGGTALLYSTYLGGSGNGSFGEGADAIALDSNSPANIYVTGFTGSPDFPPSTAVPAFMAGPPASAATGGAAFITKLAPSASGTAQLAYSSYLGGDTFDEGHGIAVDGTGNAYIAGETISTNFPTAGTQISTGLTSPEGNAFLTEINTTTTGALIYSTYLGGSGPGSNFLGFGDIAYAVTVDATSHAYVVGGTTSTDFPPAGTAITGSAACGANTNGSAFISVINTTAGTLGYSHCLSGNTAEVAFGVSLGTGVPAVVTQVAYITGSTESSNFPHTAGSIPPPTAGVATGVAFVSLVNTATGGLQYSTFLGGSNSDSGNSITSDSAGNAYVTGQTGSADFPITQGALQETLNNPNGTGFVSKISPNGQGLADLVYSTYFGGSGNGSLLADFGAGIGLFSGNVYIAGQAASPATGTNPFPVTTGSFQTTLNGSTNAFVAELPLTPTISVSPTSLLFGTQLVAVASQPQFVTVTNNTASAVTLTLPPTTTGANPADFVGAAGGTLPCTTSLAAGASCTIGVTFTPSNPVAETATLNIVDSLDTSKHPILVALSGTGSATTSNITITPTSLTLPGALLTTSTNATVSIGNNGNLPLSISAIAAAPGIFTETSNTATCNNGAFPIVIAPGGAACVVTVTFSPIATTTPGPVAGSLTVTQTGGNVNTVVLNGTAWDFSVSAAAISVAKGATGSFPVVVTGLGGFTGAVAFTCTPGMLITSCSVPTTNAAPAPGATVSGAITASSFIVPPQSMKVPPSALLRQVLFIMLAIGLLFMLPEARRFRTRLGMLGAMMVFVLVAGCSGGAGGGGSKSSTLSITPSSGGVTKTAITVNVTITQ